MSNVALQRRLSDIVEEYEAKYKAIDTLLEKHRVACETIKIGATLGGIFGESYDFGYLTGDKIKAGLLKSAWRYVYEGLNIRTISSASDRKKFEQSIERNEVPFTLDNIRATFGNYILNPRANIVRGLAEVFCRLDPAYKSHDKVKIGVAGLPKRIIMPNISNYGWGREQLTDVVTALAALQSKPLPEYNEISTLLGDGSSMQKTRGIFLERFKNGNGHLFFEPQELIDINKGLAEFYGDVLADAAEEKPTQKQTSTAVSKDLQYYPTPQKIVDEIINQLSNLSGAKILEPSCGCGRFMDALRSKGANVFGIEFDASRVAISRSKGHKVLQANFLETIPESIYDRVIMNPPFYGRHYAKHVQHALKFLKDGGILTAILPVTARYDHGLLDGEWCDLPFNAFAESGTNINTSLLTIKRKKNE